MSESVSDRIYNAQCLGNIEPVEYIVPYPNIFSLLEGENVKFGNNYLFLDQKRQYSCAYFKNENDSLETAQNNKIQHIIKKLNIKPNQKVLDIGSGWGSLAIDIAKKSQCEVVGITSVSYTHLPSPRDS